MISTYPKRFTATVCKIVCFNLLLLASISTGPVFSTEWAYAASLSLGWEANTEDDLLEYRIYYGTSSGNYEFSVDVGNVTEYELCNLIEDTTYYIALSAIDTSYNESELSLEETGVARSPELCTDAVDNDGDGLIDCDDSNCTMDLACSDTLVIEAEAMSYHANGCQSGDYWLLWANGMMSEDVYLPDTAFYYFEVVARGDLVDGIGPEMELIIDGVPVDTVPVDSETPGTYTFDVEVSAGNHTLALGFYNDTYNPSAEEDRNLYVDKITVALPSSSLTETACDDTVDNDEDGLVDCDDSDCSMDPVCSDTLLIEAEDMSYHANGCQKEDYWLLWANGMMSEDVYFPDTDFYYFEVVARGDLVDGIGPEMELIIDGVTVGTVPVDSETPGTYAFDVEVSAGDHTVAVGFYNDLYDPSSGEDRNLYVDTITVSPSSSITIEIICDNGEACTSSTGLWKEENSSDSFGNDSVYSLNKGTYKWTPDLPLTGYYEIYMWWSYLPSNCTNCPVYITCAEEIVDLVYVNQQFDTGGWNPIGTYYFEEGNVCSVTVEAEKSNISVSADAVKFLAFQ